MFWGVQRSWLCTAGCFTHFEGIPDTMFNTTNWRKTRKSGLKYNPSQMDSWNGGLSAISGLLLDLWIPRRVLPPFSDDVSHRKCFRTLWWYSIGLSMSSLLVWSRTPVSVSVSRTECVALLSDYSCVSRIGDKVLAYAQHMRNRASGYFVALIYLSLVLVEFCKFSRKWEIQTFEIWWPFVKETPRSTRYSMSACRLL